MSSDPRQRRATRRKWAQAQKANVEENAQQQLDAKVHRAAQTGKLNLSNSSLQQFPVRVCRLYDEVKERGGKWWELSELKSLVMSFNEIPTIPRDIERLAELALLDMSHNQLADVPTALLQLTELKSLNLSHNRLSGLPEDWNGLQSLVELMLHANPSLGSVPSSIAHLPNLESLNLSECGLKQLPDDLSALCKLFSLDVSGNQLERLPESVGHLPRLRSLNANKNALKSEGVPESLCHLSSLTSLQMRYNKLTCFPQLASDSQLQELFLGFNAITKVPDFLSRCDKLTHLEIRDNKLTQLGEAVCELNNLRVLDVENNDLNNLPPRVGAIEALRSLMIEGNPLRRIRRALVVAKTDELKQFLRNRIVPGEPHRAVDDTLSGEQTVADVEEEDIDKDSPLLTLYRDAQYTHKLDIREAKLDTISPRVWKIEALQQLDLSHNRLSAVDDGCVSLSHSLVRVVLHHNNFREFPRALTQLTALRELVLAHNAVSSSNAWHSALAGMRSLRVLDLRNNRITAFSPVFLEMPALEELILSHNQMAECDALDRCVARASHLQVLDISNNQVACLPSGVQHMKHLRHLDVNNNNIRRIPPEVSLCDKLRYFTVVGNPLRGMRHELVQRGGTTLLNYLSTRLPVQAQVPEPVANKEPCGEVGVQTGDQPSPVHIEPVKSVEPVEQPPMEPQHEAGAQEPVELQPASSQNQRGPAPQVNESMEDDAPAPPTDYQLLHSLDKRIADLIAEIEGFGVSRAMSNKLRKQLASARGQRVREARRLRSLGVHCPDF